MDIIHDTRVGVSQALLAAADILAANGLAIDTFVDYAEAEKTSILCKAPVCAVGAIRIAYGYDPDDSDADARRCPALAALAEWLICTQRVRRDREPDDELFIIAIWSDIAGEHGGVDAVVAGLRQAATEVS